MSLSERKQDSSYHSEAGAQRRICGGEQKFAGQEVGSAILADFSFPAGTLRIHLKQMASKYHHIRATH